MTRCLFVLLMLLAPPLMAGPKCPDPESLAVFLRAAAGDDYQPPPGGRLREAQVRSFLAVTETARRLLQACEKELAAGVGPEAARARALVMAVESGGDDWAEQAWVARRLRTALRVAELRHHSLDPAAAHNVMLMRLEEDAVRSALEWWLR